MTTYIAALDQAAERAADFLRSVAHPGRLRIVCSLLAGEQSASELAAHARLRGPALSQQAAILEAQGVIARRREARSVLYRLVAPEAQALAELLYKYFCRAESGRATRPRKQGAKQ